MNRGTSFACPFIARKLSLRRMVKSLSKRSAIADINGELQSRGPETEIPLTSEDRRLQSRAVPLEPERCVGWFPIPCPEPTTLLRLASATGPVGALTETKRPDPAVRGVSEILFRSRRRSLIASTRDHGVQVSPSTPRMRSRI